MAETARAVQQLPRLRAIGEGPVTRAQARLQERQEEEQAEGRERGEPRPRLAGPDQRELQPQPPVREPPEREPTPARTLVARASFTEEQFNEVVAAAMAIRDPQPAEHDE